MVRSGEGGAKGCEMARNGARGCVRPCAAEGFFWAGEGEVAGGEIRGVLQFEPIKSMVPRGLSPENAEEKYSYVQCLASTAQLIMIQYAMTKTEMSESSGCGKLSCLWRGAILAIVL